MMFRPCLAVLLALSTRLSDAAYCELLEPVGSEGMDIGIIMIPGANYPGELYIPLGEAIQMALPHAKLWVGITEGWLIDTPNPIEIAGAISDCKQKVAEASLSGPVYLAGHSLGGVMLEQYLQNQDNMDETAGVLLLGSYLTDFILGTDNSYPVPALTVIGSNDGLSLSYLFREWKESKNSSHPDQYPVYAAIGPNHAQVGSGPVPDFVKSRDLQSSVSETEAHTIYSEMVASFLVQQNQDKFDAEVVAEAANMAASFELQTEVFLEPFIATSLMETDGVTSEWMKRGQKIIMSGNPDEDLSGLEVENIVVEFSDLGNVKPSVEGSDCTATAVTYCQPQYDWDVADAATLQSASIIKAKFKLEDNVREALCLQPAERRQCMDINVEALKVALEMSSEEARNRYLTMGTQLFFLDDSVSPWGPGWEYSSGLHYKNVNETHTSLYSTSLISEPDFIIATAAGMHYCDLLSPYRALEWIYLTSVVGKYN